MILAQNVTTLDANALPNPYTPLAFLPPHLAFQASFAVYVMVCCLAVIIWDILHTLSADYKMAFKQRFSHTTFVYFLSRCSALSYIAGKTVQLTAELPDCQLFETIMCALYTLTRGSTALLLYFRVCAVYNNHPAVLILFAITWLFVVGGAATTFGIVGVPVGATRYCTSQLTGEYLIAIGLSDFVNDTLVFLAIMWRLSSRIGERTDELHGVRIGTGSHVESQLHTRTPSGWSAMKRLDWRAMRLLKSPVSFQRLTDVFLQDSQVFYLIAVVINLATLITFFAVHPAESPFRVVLIFPNTTVLNIMACRVYRNMKTGRPGLLPAPTATDTLAPLDGMRTINSNGTSAPPNGLTESIYFLGKESGRGKGGTDLNALELGVTPLELMDEEARLSGVGSNAKGNCTTGHEIIRTG